MKLNNTLLKNLLPGLIPLFVFILAEELWGLKTGLMVAVVFGIAEFIYTYLKSRKIETFILIDILLLVIMGVISIILENDLFFKFKPALIEFILAVIIGLSVFGPKNIIFSMSKRYIKGLPANGAVMGQMNKSLRVLFFIIIAHIALIIYAAYFLSDEMWAFISGVLFYLLFAGYIGFEFLKNRFFLRKYKNSEWFPIVTPEGEVIGKKPREICHDGKNKALHPVVHLHVFNKSGKLFLQKRPLHKDVQPGKWDTSVGGHVMYGEPVDLALIRESGEEIGLTGFKYEFITRHIWESDVERELVYLFYTINEKPITLNNTEVDEGKYWKISEINQNLGKGLFTPNFEFEFNNILLPLIRKKFI